APARKQSGLTWANASYPARVLRTTAKPLSSSGIGVTSNPQSLVGRRMLLFDLTFRLSELGGFMCLTPLHAGRIFVQRPAEFEICELAFSGPIPTTTARGRVT